MSRKTVEYCMCDICGKEGAEGYSALAYRTFDGNDGRTIYDKPVFRTVSIDLCKECASKVTSLHDIGICCKEYEIKPIEGKDEP